MRAIWSFLKGAFWGIIVLGVFLLMIVSSFLPGVRREKACERAGGHYVASIFTADECWSDDGRRIFPGGF